MTVLLVHFTAAGAAFASDPETAVTEVVGTAPWYDGATGTVRVQSDTSGAGRRAVRLELANTLLLLRDRVSASGEREYTGGFESAAVSVGPLEGQGFIRTVEAPQALSPISVSLREGGGYRLMRSEGYDRPPGIALRSSGASAFHNTISDTSITGASLDKGVDFAGVLPTVVRFFAVHASPLPDTSADDWALDRRASVPGPLWYLGIESVGELGRGEVIVSSGPAAAPGVMVTTIADLRGAAGELLAGLSAATEEFAGAHGERSEYRFRLAMRLSRPKAEFLRPRVQTEYAHLALAPMPADMVPREYAAQARLQLGPESMYIQPEWSGRIHERADASTRARQEAGVRISAGEGPVRVSAGALRRVDEEEAGLVRADGELRLQIDTSGCDDTRGECRRSLGDRDSGGDTPGGRARAYDLKAGVRVEREDEVEDRRLAYWDAAFEPTFSARLRMAVKGEAMQASFAVELGEGGIPISQLAGALGSPATHSTAEITLQYSGRLTNGVTRGATHQ